MQTHDADPSLRRCHVLDTGAGCYLSLEAQFTFPGKPVLLSEGMRMYMM